MFVEALWLLSGKVLFFVVVVFSSARLAVERKLLCTVCVVVQLFRDMVCDSENRALLSQSLSSRRIPVGVCLVLCC